MADQVTLQLAHPLTADQAARLRATEVGERNIGDAITVPHDEALAIINAGYALGIDPADGEAVRQAVRGEASAGEPSAFAVSTAPTPADTQPPDAASSRGAAKKTDGGR